MPTQPTSTSQPARRNFEPHNRNNQPNAATTERAVTEPRLVSSTVVAPVRRVTRSLAKALPPSASANEATPLSRPDDPICETAEIFPRDARTPSPQNKPRVGADHLPHIHTTEAPDRPQSDLNHPIQVWAAKIERDSQQDEKPRSRSENFWAQRGYEEPASSAASHSSVMTDSSVTPSQSRQTSTRRAKSDRTARGPETVRARDAKKFPVLLTEHNVNILPEEHHDVRDNDMRKILSKKLPTNVGFAVDETLTALEARWKRDMDKCIVSNEALFQRTIMMEILERDELDEKLDFICETPWRADRLPGRNDTQKLAQPKPDLAVGFKTTSLLPPGTNVTSLARLGALRSHVSAEGTSKGEVDRAFHFFSMEVKGKRGQIDNSEAELQNLNTAAQGLYNIYVIMKEAGMEDEFFKEVRFFTVVATTSCFEIRIHRARKILLDDFIRPDCGIGFGFDETIKIGSGYDKKTATTFVFNILLHYGIKKLYPVLRKSMSIVLKKFPGIVGLQQSSQQRSLSKGKRSRDDELSESFESHGSQRRRMEQLAVAG